MPTFFTFKNVMPDNFVLTLFETSTAVRATCSISDDKLRSAFSIAFRFKHDDPFKPRICLEIFFGKKLTEYQTIAGGDIIAG